MKRILGLDLGVGSIGWAVVEESETPHEKSRIINAGTRVNPLTVDEQGNFEKGKPITTNSERTLKRGLRRRLIRYKLRRDALIKLFKREKWITDLSPLSEDGECSTHSTLCLRAKSLREKISLQDLSRVFLMINKKRGYKSNRKQKTSSEEGQLINETDVSIRMQREGKTCACIALEYLENGKKVPQFYASDLHSEYELIWECQKKYHPHILTEEMKQDLKGRDNRYITKTFSDIGVEKTEQKGDKKEKEKRVYELRVKALSCALEDDELAYVIASLGGEINKSCGNYLGNISDRSKEIKLKGETIGEYLYRIIKQNPHESIKNMPFYRKDYETEYDRIWEAQSAFHPEMTPERKKEIYAIMFFQRPLRSCKGLVALCQFEHKEVQVKMTDERTGTEKTVTKIKGSPCIPKSSPLYQEFRIWQRLGDLKIKSKFRGKEEYSLSAEDKEKLYRELSVHQKMKQEDILKVLNVDAKEYTLNFKELEGNRTQTRLYEAYRDILDGAGSPIGRKTSASIKSQLKEKFRELGYDTSILEFNPLCPYPEVFKQKSYELWHLLYSYDGDNSPTGEESLVNKIMSLTGMKRDEALIL